MSETSDSDILMNGEEWFAKNWRLLLNGALVILVGVAGYNWLISSGAQSASAAEKNLHGVISSNTTNLVQMALELNGVHMTYPESSVGQRALILSANISLQEGDYETAKKRFESYLSKYSKDGDWLLEAKLGQGICMEAEGDASNAVKVFQSLTNSNIASIKQRAAALLNAADIDLEPLPSRPVSVKVEPEIDKVPKADGLNNIISPSAPVPVSEK